MTSTAVLTVSAPIPLSGDREHHEDSSARNRAWAEGIRASDVGAYERFFRAIHGSLVHYAERLVDDSAVAGDLAQETLVRIWERRDTLDPERSIKALAYRTLRNLSLNRIRDRKNRASLLAEEYEPPSQAPLDPQEEFGGSRLAERLTEWIAELPDRQREALQLSRFQGLSHDEVADVMGVSARTVNNHLVRALRSIRDRVRAYEPSLLDS